MDKYFPRYHFRPKKNWMNDPNGLIWHNGFYHMFYQYNPNQDIWGDIHWGHARSEDLIHWEECPVAFGPSYERGELHCYSGCCVEKDDKVHAFYTSIGAGEAGPETGAVQWSAVSGGDLMAWEKPDHPALDKTLNAPYDVRMWRDPFIWKERGFFFMLLSGTLDGKGCILLYSSEDLERWECRSVFYVNESYSLIECPNIMKFGDRYILLYSPLEAIRYVTGTIDWESFRFVPEREGIFDYSVGKKGFYASNVYMNAPDGRYLMFGCLFEGDRLNSAQKRGWAGIQSLPREITLGEDGTPRIHPAKECRMLRQETLVALEKCRGGRLEAESEAFEIHLCIRPEEKSDHREPLKIRLLASPDGREYTELTVDFAARRILLDRDHSTLTQDITKERIEAELPECSGPTEMDIFVDHSTIEVFFAGILTISARIFPALAESRCNTVSIPESIWAEQAAIYGLGL